MRRLSAGEIGSGTFIRLMNFIRPLSALCVATLLSAAGLCARAAGSESMWELKPGVTVRGQAPQTWTLDLRQKTKAAAEAQAAQLSSRIYGSGGADLHQPLRILTAFSRAKVLGFEIAAVSAGGSDLVVKTNGTLARQIRWPASKGTAHPQQLLYVSVPAGDMTVALEVTQAGGVVIIGQYLVADSEAAFPEKLHPVALEAFAVPVGSKAAAAAERPLPPWTTATAASGITTRRRRTSTSSSTAAALPPIRSSMPRSPSTAKRRTRRFSCTAARPRAAR